MTGIARQVDETISQACDCTLKVVLQTLIVTDLQLIETNVQ